MKVLRIISLFFCFFLLSYALSCNESDFVDTNAGLEVEDTGGTTNGNGSTDDGIVEDDDDDNDDDTTHSHEWPPAEGGQDGLFSVLGHLMAIGDMPTLSTCGTLGVDVELLAGSTDTAGKLYIANPVTGCTINFVTPFSGFHVCVASGNRDSIAVTTYLLDPSAFRIEPVGGGSFQAFQAINYICIDLIHVP